MMEMETLFIECKKSENEYVEFKILDNGDVLVIMKTKDSHGYVEGNVILDRYKSLKIIEFLGGSL